MTASTKISLSQRLDGWMNILTGMGFKNRDKKASSYVQWERPVEQDLEEFYAADALARKIVDLPVFEAMNKGYKITGFDKETNEKLKEAGKKLHVDESVAGSWRWARLYGGAGVMLITDGLSTPQNPMRPNEMLKSLTVLSRFELHVDFSRIQKDLLKPNFGMPEYYQFQPATSNAVIGDNKTAYTANIHQSRLIRFEGLKLPKRMMVNNQYWGDSVLTALKESIRNYQTAHSNACTVIEDFSVGVMKLNNLASQVAADGDELVTARLQIVNLTKSMSKMIVLDAEGEDFQYQTRNVSGLPELLGKAESHLVAETNIPNTVLFGNSPTGLGGSGNHETNNWYDYLTSEQENYLKPKLLEIYQHLAVDMQLDPSKVGIEFNPLYEMDAKEEAEIRKIQAETDAIYVTNAVLDADEIAENRFGGDEYSTDTKLINERLINEPVPTPGVV